MGSLALAVLTGRHQSLSIKSDNRPVFRSALNSMYAHQVSAVSTTSTAT